MNSAYIHIPFCEHICHYCDFNKMFLKGQPVEHYLQMLKKEMELTLQQQPTEHLSTIYVGGGTPTSLNEEQLRILCDSIEEVLPFDRKTVEYSFEANPGDLPIEKLRVLKNAGVNRLSFGVQAFQEHILKGIGRTHRPEDVYDSIYKAREAGFENITIDLMYGLPGQTMKDFEESLQKALALDLPHYSSYSLIVEPKTVFYNLMQKDKLQLPSQDLEAEMYELLMDTMEANGRKHYEISNFAKSGFESKHNTTYWNNDYYYGFGAGAHSYVNGERIANYGPLKKYMTPIENGKLPRMSVHPVPLNERLEEEMFLGLRKMQGVSLSLFQKRFDQDMLLVFKEQIEELLERQLVVIHDDHLMLTREGKLLGNEVFQTFIGIG